MKMITKNRMKKTIKVTQMIVSAMNRRILGKLEARYGKITKMGITFRTDLRQTLTKGQITCFYMQFRFGCKNSAVLFPHSLLPRTVNLTKSF